MNTQNTREQIGEIIGEASMCWSETPTGIFQSDKAVTLIDKLEAIASQSCQQGRMEATEEWKQYMLNILDGVDIADEKEGITGGTKAIRLAIQSRI